MYRKTLRFSVNFSNSLAEDRSSRIFKSNRKYTRSPYYRHSRSYKKKRKRKKNTIRDPEANQQNSGGEGPSISRGGCSILSEGCVQRAPHFSFTSGAVIRKRNASSECQGLASSRIDTTRRRVRRRWCSTTCSIDPSAVGGRKQRFPSMDSMGGGRSPRKRR